MKKATADNLKLLGGSTIAAVLLAAIFTLTRRVELVAVLFVGLTVVTLAAGLFMVLSKKFDRRKQKKSEAGKDPSVVKEKTEKLRGSFEAGLEKIVKAGKDVYETPWYLMMGLSSAGKTEAIRHSGLDFPPTLHEENQGQGGTQKLDWWFTKDAVFLDTIGEWITEDHGEWDELLHLLKTHRPMAPINGVVLAVSAENLVLENEEKNKAKASAVARKLDAVQQGLGIRFPVFVVVTKCDLVTGFRSFFFGDESQDFRNQLVGWSNTGGLEDKIDAAKIEQSMEPLLNSLKAHRLTLFAASAGGSLSLNYDQTLRMMTFPDNLKNIVPKLKLWLETIFMGGEWTARPLFLRGVYFTSAKQTGWEIDAELSRKFTLPDSDRIEERNPGRQRAHFLLDLFKKKVIAEKGLVLRADRRRTSKKIGQIVTWSAAFLVLVSFILLTRLGYSRLEKAIGNEQGFWVAAAENSYWTEAGRRPAWKPVVIPASNAVDKFVYTGADPVFQEDKIDTGRFLDTVIKRSKEPLDIPWVFRMSAGFSGDLDSDRPKAAKALFEASVLFPLVHAARVKISSQKAELWTPICTAALAELLKLEAQAKKNVDKGPAGLDLEALFAFVLQDSPTDYEVYKQHHFALFAQAMKDLYDDSAWRPASLGAGSVEAGKAIELGKNAFVLNWSRQIESQKSNAHLRGVASLTEGGTAFLKAEKVLMEMDANFATASSLPATAVILGRVSGEWDKVFSAIVEARALIEANVGLLSTGTLEAAYDQKGAKALEEIELSFNKILDPLEGVDAGGAAPGTEEPFLARLQRELKDQLARLKGAFKSGAIREEIKKLDENLYRVMAAPEAGRPAQRAYETRYSLYSRASEAMKARVPAPSLFTLSEELGGAAAAFNLARDEIRKKVSGPAAQSDPLAKEALESSLFAVALAEKAAVFSMAKSAIDSVRNSESKFDEAALSRASLHKPLQRTAIFMIKPPAPNFEQKFNPAVMIELAKNRKALVRHLGDPDAPEVKPEDPLLDADQVKISFAKITPVIRNYFGAAADYWIGVAREGLRVGDFSWQEFVSSLREFQQWEINTALGGTLNLVENALKDPDLPFDGPVKERIQALMRDIAAARNQIKDQEGNLFLAQCKNIAGGWGAFKDTPPAAVRLRLLELTPQKVKDNFVIASSGESKDLILRYWEDLTWRALNALAQDFQRNSADALGELKASQLFPLASLAAGRPSLTPDRVDHCRAQLERVRPSLARLPKDSVGAGAKTNFDRLDKTLDQLAWLAMTEDDRKWVMAADQVLSALPEKGAAPLSCEVILPSKDNQKVNSDRAQEDYNAVSALMIWRSLEMNQGGEKVARRAQSDPAEDKSLGKFAYPGANLDIHFYKNPSDDKPDVTITEEGPWGALSLLHRFDAKRSAEDPKIWTVVVSAKDAKGFVKKLWLNLKFDRVLPELKDWPRG